MSDLEDIILTWFMAMFFAAVIVAVFSWLEDWISHNHDDIDIG